ncbi:hypothetical protein ACJBW8_11125, partial [Streptococcus suis]|nr:hypothetical protein [Streptococcus suis]MCL4913445.1 hypothetical protein [Streptococcus suis]
MFEKNYEKSQKSAIFKNIRDKNKYFAIKNQKNAIFLKFGQQKHTKISSEEISDGREYLLLFLYVK